MSDTPQTVSKLPSKIVQIVANIEKHDPLYLCEDGSVWAHWPDAMFHLVHPPHTPAQPEPPATRWISVQERVPPNSKAIDTPTVTDFALALNPYREIEVLQYSYVSHRWYDRNGLVCERKITHWMPLPEPPEVR